MPGEFDRQRAIRFFRLPNDADDARIAQAVRGMASRYAGMWRCFRNRTDLDPVGCLAVIEWRLGDEDHAAMKLEDQIDALIRKKRERLRRANSRILALNLIRFSCYAPEDARKKD